MDTKTVIGLIAGTLTTISFLPQLTKVLKTKSVNDISLVMFTVLSIGSVLWIIYGIMLKSLPLILFNSISFFLVGTILFLKVKHQGK